MKKEIENVNFSAGDLVELKLTGEKLMVLKKGKEQYECRLANTKTAYFYDFELSAIA